MIMILQNYHWTSSSESRHIDLQQRYRSSYNKVEHIDWTLYKDIDKLYNFIDSVPLDPWFVTGFTDGEGSFIVSVRKDKEYKHSYAVTVTFQISQHSRDLQILNKIKTFFKDRGYITWAYRPTGYICRYNISNPKDINDYVLPHFDKYELITQKKADYMFFRKVVLMMVNKDHLTLEGLSTIVSYRASMNKGLSPSLKKSFSNVVPVTRPIIIEKVSNPQWVSGFISGEGCFSFHLRTGTDRIYSANINVGQDVRDTFLIKSFIDYFKLGHLTWTRNMVYFRVTGLENLHSTIMKHFIEYPVLGVKYLDFIDWCKVLELIKSGLHRTEPVKELITNIRKNNNKARKLELKSKL